MVHVMTRYIAQCLIQQWILCSQVPAARLLVHVKEEFLLTELIALLAIDCFDLRQLVLVMIFNHAYHHRGRMMEIADAIRTIGAPQCLSAVLSLIEDESDRLAPKVCVISSQRFYLACFSGVVVWVLNCMVSSNE